MNGEEYVMLDYIKILNITFDNINVEHMLLNSVIIGELNVDMLKLNSLQDKFHSI